MDDNITFNPSAFRHGISKENIRHVIDFSKYEGPIEEFSDKYIVVGFDKTGKLLEILYRRIDNDTIDVFHAMECRSIFFHLLDT